MLRPPVTHPHLTPLRPPARPPARLRAAPGLSPLTVVREVREMCEKLKVVVGSDNLSREAQVRSFLKVPSCFRGCSRASGPANSEHGSCPAEPAMDYMDFIGSHRPPTQRAPTSAALCRPAPHRPQRNATLLWFCLLRSTFASKRVLSEYKLTDEAFRWLAGEVSNK